MVTSSQYKGNESGIIKDDAWESTTHYCCFKGVCSKMNQQLPWQRVEHGLGT